MIISGSQLIKLHQAEKKTLSIFQILLEELSLKLLYNVLCTSLPDQSYIIYFTAVNFSWMISHVSKTSQIFLVWNKNTLSTFGGFSNK